MSMRVTSANAYPKIIQRLSDYWSSCTQLRGQLRLLAVKYPLGVTVLQAQNGMSGFKVTATIVFRNVKAKALVSFILDMQTFASWPMSIGATNCEVDVIYGPIESVPSMYLLPQELTVIISQARHNI